MKSASNKIERKQKESLATVARFFFKSPLVLWLLISNLAFNLAAWIVPLIFIRPIDKAIILHYNVYFGVDMTGNWQQVFFLPGIGFTILFLNSILALFFYYKKERIASYILLMAALMGQMSLLIATATVIMINY